MPAMARCFCSASFGFSLLLIVLTAGGCGEDDDPASDASPGDANSVDAVSSDLKASPDSPREPEIDMHRETGETAPDARVDSSVNDAAADGATDARPEAGTDLAIDASSVCMPGQHQTCNENPALSSLHGVCLPDGTCICNAGFVKNPSSGRCL
jgi:hypothetical protein